MLLYFLLLRRMLLLKLLRLLSVPLFHLLFLYVVGTFLRSLLVFLFLLLLGFLVFLILFRGKLFLLLLVFLAGRGIASVGRIRMRLYFASVVVWFWFRGCCWPILGSRRVRGRVVYGSRVSC